MESIPGTPINIFTFNMGGTHDEDWETYLQSQEWSEIFGQKDEIYVVCTQEDQKESLLINALKQTYLPATTHECEVCKSKILLVTDLTFGLKPFYIHLAVFYPYGKTASSISKKIIYHPTSIGSIVDAIKFLRYKRSVHPDFDITPPGCFTIQIGLSHPDGSTSCSHIAFVYRPDGTYVGHLSVQRLDILRWWLGHCCFSPPVSPHHHWHQACTSEIKDRI